MSDTVSLVEVAPRDGLQNVALPVSTADKIRLIHEASTAGLTRIEVTSFVRPDRVPQMADAERVVAGVRGRVNARLTALVLNPQGAERAIAAGVDELTFVVLATEEFNQRNQGCSRERSLAQWTRVVDLAHRHGLTATFLVGAAFGCPYTGEVSESAVLDLAKAGVHSGADEIALADTIGCGVPTQVHSLFGRLRTLAGGVPMRAHFHNTRNTGYGNAFAAVAAGVRYLDSSLGGIGGCPFAPNATGNIATEDLAWMLSRAGLLTSVNVDRALAAAAHLRALGLDTPALLDRAGTFPTPNWG